MALFSFMGLTNKQIQQSDIKLGGNNSIKLSPDAIAKISLIPDTTRLFIDRNALDKKFYIAAIPVVRNDKGVVVSPGRPASADGKLSHQQLHAILGAEHSEWMIKGEAIEDEGISYFEIVQTVDGATKRNAESTEALAAADLSQNDNVVAQFDQDELPEVIDNIEASVENIIEA